MQKRDYKKEIPKDWRYNVKELRMEKRVAVYGEDEKYTGHMWGALVPDDILFFVESIIKQERDEVIKEIESKKISEKEIQRLYKQGFGSAAKECEDNNSLVDDILDKLHSQTK